MTDLTSAELRLIFLERNLAAGFLRLGVFIVLPGESGEIFAGNSVELSFPNPLTDSRTPDIIVAPNVGVVYTGGTSKVSEHGGFAYDDRNVLLIVSNPSYSSSTYTGMVETRQVAPTVLQALGYDPSSLQGVQKEGTEVLPGLPFTKK